MIDSPIHLFDLPLNSRSKSELLKKLRLQLKMEQQTQLLSIATLNPEQVVQAQTDDKFRSVLKQFSLIVADGVGIVWATRFLTGAKMERIPGVELAEALVNICASHNQKVFLLGGKKGVAKRAANQLIGELDNRALEQTTSVDLINFSTGAVDIVHETKTQRAQVLKKIHQQKPALLLVGYGAPYQEIWIQENRDELERAGVKVAMVVGGAFDYWSGDVPRAPLRLRQIGVEWLFRLITQPWRWRRQLRLIRFVTMVVAEKFKQRTSSSKT